MEQKQAAYASEKKVLAAISAIQRENDRARMVTGCDFSVFGPDLLHLDENAASRILAHLLNPAAGHGQAALFLRRVLQLLRIPELAKIDASTVSVAASVERVTYGAKRFRRLDIMLEGDTFVVGIENKLGAGEQQKQLADYLDWLESIGKHYYLVYLTPQGQDASEYSLPQKARAHHAGHFFLLSWEKLLDALWECATKIPPRIAYFVEDFYKSIREQKLGVSTMEIDKNIVDFLANQTTSEELRAAAAIFESYTKSANQIILDWVMRLKNELAPKISGKITIPDKFEYNQYEIHYLIIGWAQWKMGIQIMNFTYKHGNVPARTVLWGEVIWREEYKKNGEDALADSWVQKLMKGFGKQELIGNMINVNALGRPTDPEFLVKIRDKEPPYLFDKLLNTALKVEHLRAEWEKTKASTPVAGVNPVG